jgi:hypothetical protein
MPGPFSSSSRTSSTNPAQTGPVTASQGTAGAQQVTGGGKNTRTIAVSQGATSLQDHAQLGGYRLGNVAAGAHVTINAADDDDVGMEVADALERAIGAQANTTAAAISSLGNLSNPNAPPPDEAPALPLPEILTFSAAAAALALLIGVLVFAFRR